MGRVRKNPEERRHELFMIAWELFTTKGYNNTNVQDITDAAHVSKATFFYYFDTKKDLLHELILDNLGTFISLYLIPKPIEETFQVQFQKFIDGVFLDLYSPSYRKFTLETSYLYDEEFLEKLCETVKPFHHNLLKKGINEGVLHIEPNNMDLCLISIQEIVISTWRMNLRSNNPNVRSLYTIPAFENLLGISKGIFH